MTLAVVVLGLLALAALGHGLAWVIRGLMVRVSSAAVVVLVWGLVHLAGITGNPALLGRLSHALAAFYTWGARWALGASGARPAP